MAITKIEVPELFDFGSDNSAFKLPTGTTAERPTSPSNGEMRFNTTTGYVEYYDTTDAQWWEIDYAPDPFVPSENFNTVLYTGTAPTTKVVTGVGFQPDFVWGKSRTTTADHNVVDSVRGLGNNTFKALSTSTTDAENTTTSNNILSLDLDGFTIQGSGSRTNSPGQDYVAWNWKAGGTAVSNTDGTITSQVSANVDAGFSIVKWTGNDSASQTIGHGLSSTPELYIIKKTSAALAWQVNLSSLVTGTEGYLLLDRTLSMYTTFPNYYTSANNTVLSTNGTSTAERQYNNQSANYIAYAFHSVAGYSKMGSYVGNGSATGPIVTLGFEPAWVMIKRTDAGAAWCIFDSARNTTNSRYNLLQAQDSAAELDLLNLYGLNGVDFLSTSFQLKDANTSRNANGGTYIFMAFATNPT